MSTYDSTPRHICQLVVDYYHKDPAAAAGSSYRQSHVARQSMAMQQVAPTLHSYLRKRFRNRFAQVNFQTNLSTYQLLDKSVNLSIVYFYHKDPAAAAASSFRQSFVSRLAAGASTSVKRLAGLNAKA